MPRRPRLRTTPRALKSLPTTSAPGGAPRISSPPSGGPAADLASGGTRAGHETADGTERPSGQAAHEMETGHGRFEPVVAHRQAGALANLVAQCRIQEGDFPNIRVIPGAQKQMVHIA